MTKFCEKYGPWALVTGASAGIGEEFARQLAAQGLNVVIAARRKERLGALAAQLKEQYGVEVRTVVCDLYQDDYLDLLDEATKDLEIGLLVNNAGHPAMRVYLMDRAWQDIEAFLRFNVTVQVRLSHFFGRPMKERGRGGIIQVSSIHGHLAMPTFVEYSSTKAFQLSFSESLHHELKPFGVDTLVVAPGATISERISEGMTAEFVVKSTLNALGKKASIVPGFRNWFWMFRWRQFATRNRMVKLCARMLSGSPMEGDGSFSNSRKPDEPMESSI